MNNSPERGVTTNRLSAVQVKKRKSLWSRVLVVGQGREVDLGGTKSTMVTGRGRLGPPDYLV